MCINCSFFTLIFAVFLLIYRLSRGESVLTLSLVVRKVSLIAISPNVRRLLIKVLEVLEAFQQTAYGSFL